MPYPIQVLSVCNAYTLFFFFFLDGGKNVCAYSPTIPRGLSHGPNVRACTISKKDVDSGHPKFVYTDKSFQNMQSSNTKPTTTTE